MGMVRDFYVLAISSIRAVLPQLPILLHDSFHGDMWAMMLKYFPFDNVFMDTHIYHGFNPSDIASNSYEADKLKMYVHERMSCAMTSMLRYETCSAAPTLTGEWSLAIDNCMDAIDRKFQNYGQCDRIAMRNKDPWWKAHIRSFAHRQMDVYERELGWSFWTYKLDSHAETTAESAALWSFRLAVQEGYIDTTYPKNVCMHNPVADWQGGAPAAPAVPETPAATDKKEELVVVEEEQQQQFNEDVHAVDAAHVLAAVQTHKNLEAGAAVAGGEAPPARTGFNFSGIFLGLIGVALVLGGVVVGTHLQAAGLSLADVPAAVVSVLPHALTRRGDYESVADATVTHTTSV